MQGSLRRVRTDKMQFHRLDRHTGKVVIGSIIASDPVPLFNNDKICVGKKAVKKLSLVTIFAGGF